MHMNSSEERVQHKALNNIRNLYQKVGRERQEQGWAYAKP
jgi:intracellular sulfur oxidation DsrE/DsrF family protein